METPMLALCLCRVKKVWVTIMHITLTSNPRKGTYTNIYLNTLGV